MSTPKSQKAKISKGTSTSNQLLDAAERLFAELGVANVSVRAIVAEAGQRNESALHYHFGNRNGLIRALHERRNLLVKEKRRQFLDALRAETNEPNIRQLCEILVKPGFVLAQNDQGFRNYLMAFGQFFVSTDRELTGKFIKYEADAVVEVGLLLKKRLSQYDDNLFFTRLEAVARFAVLSMSLFASEDGEMVGPKADFFFHNLLDTMTAILTAEVSEQTRKARRGD